MSKYSEYVLMLALFLLALLFYNFYFGDVASFGVPNLYQGRDLTRAFDLYHQFKFIWHGPELTVAGRLPGPFYYYLLGLPLSISDSFEAAIYFEFILAALATVAVWKFVKRYSSPGAIIAYFLVLGSSYFLNLLQACWNPSYLPLFAILALWFLSKTENHRSLFLGGVICGLGLQIHFVEVVFLIGFLIALCFENYTDEQKLRKAGWVLGGVMLPLLPYMLYRLICGDINLEGSFFAGLWTFLFKFNSGSYSLDRQSLAYIGDALAFNSENLFLLPTFLLTLLFTKAVYERNKFLAVSFLISIIPVIRVLQIIEASRYLFPLALLAALVASVAAPENFVGRNRRYYFILGITVSAVFITRLYNNHTTAMSFSLPDLQRWLPVLTVGLLITCFGFGRVFEKGLFAGLLLLVLVNASYTCEGFAAGPKTKKSDYHLQLKEGKELINEVLSTTGWDYQYFREHTFFKTARKGQDLSFLYNSFLRKTTYVPAEKFDGLIIKHRFNRETVIPEVIERALDAGEITCRKNSVLTNLDLCFYKFSDPARVRKINNLGHGYDYSQPPLFEVSDKAGVRILSEAHAVFYLNQCIDLNPNCNIFFDFMINNGVLRVSALGNPIGQAVAAINTAFTARFDSPAVTVFCRAGSRSFILAGSLGIQAERSTVLAPFDADFKLPCKNPDKILLSLQKYKTIVMFYNHARGIPLELEWDRQKVRAK